VLQEKGFFLFSDYSLNDEHWKFKRNISSLMGERCNIFIKKDASLSDEMSKAGFKVQETKHVQFSTLFKLERYLRSKAEMERLKINNPELWKDVQMCIKNKKLSREFIFIIGVK